MTFEEFEKALQAQFDAMLKKSKHLFLTDTDQSIWDVYLKSFPEGTNPIFRVRTEHDCVYCRRFIQRFGNVVIIDDKYKLISIWDIKNLSSPYDVVAKELSEHVKARKIKEPFYFNEYTLGVAKNRAYENDQVVTYNHFHLQNVPTNCYYTGIALNGQKSEMLSRHETFSLSLNQFKESHLQDVLDLISDNNIYRGKEFESTLKDFLNVLRDFNALKAFEKENFIWKNLLNYSVPVTKIRGSAIGTLLIDLANDLSLDEAVKKFESIMAPSNYKRPKAVVSGKMVEEATKNLSENGYLKALYRRSATETDIPVKECLFINRDLKKLLDVFDEIKETLPINPFKFNNLSPISFDKFLEMLPQTKSVELLFSKQIETNLVTLLTCDDDKKLFKWDSPISWAYNGDVTDSIKARVEKAGGNVNGKLRISLAWNNFDDLDIHLQPPDGREIYFGNLSSSYCQLDVDANRGEPLTKVPVENIIFPNTVPDGHYVAYVHNYRYRQADHPGFKVDLEFLGNLYTFDYPEPIRQGSKIIAFDFVISEKGKVITIKNASALKSSVSSETIWNVKTNVFQKVSMILPSPNYWNNKQIGNKHYFFIVPGVKNTQPVLPFFNEYLNNDVLVHKRFVEVLSNKLRVTPTDDQISGFGFSETQNFELIVKADSQIIKIKK